MEAVKCLCFLALAAAALLAACSSTNQPSPSPSRSASPSTATPVVTSRAAAATTMPAPVSETPGAIPALSPEPPASPAPDAVLVGAGDIASCDNDNDEATAALLDAIPGTVFTAGDNVYNSGTPSEFAN